MCPFSLRTQELTSNCLQRLCSPCPGSPRQHPFRVVPAHFKPPANLGFLRLFTDPWGDSCAYKDIMYRCSQSSKGAIKDPEPVCRTVVCREGRPQCWKPGHAELFPLLPAYPLTPSAPHACYQDKEVGDQYLAFDNLDSIPVPHGVQLLSSLLSSPLSSSLPSPPLSSLPLNPPPFCGSPVGGDLRPQRTQ